MTVLPAAGSGLGLRGALFTKETSTMATVSYRACCRFTLALLLAVTAMQWAAPVLAARCYVDPSAMAGLGNGQTWGNAYLSLQSALTNTGCTEIWVAKGVYTPVVPANASSVTTAERAVGFDLNRSVAVYGGFAGGETSLTDRVPAPYGTILSGDIDHNDTNADGNHVDETTDDIVGSNSYHVVTISGSVTLDAVTITGGDADGAFVVTGVLFPGDRGGGIYCERAATLTNSIVSDNYGTYGGGMYNQLSSPQIHDVTFTGNRGSVGGMFNNGDSSPTLSNVTFYGNIGDNAAGALANNGGNPILRNVTFSANQVTDGRASAMASIENSAPSLSNVIMWGDTPTGNEIQNFQGAMPSIDHSVIQGLNDLGNTDYTDGGGNIGANPNLGTLGYHGGWTPTVLLGFDSSAMNTGDPAVCISPPVNGLDQRGVWRFEGQNTLCDVGAVEMKLVTDRIFADGFDVATP